MSGRKGFVAVALVALTLAALPAAAADEAVKKDAAEPKPYSDLSDRKFWISLGAFLPSFDTDVRADSEEVPFPGTTFNLEDDLGLSNDASNYRIDFVWRIAPRHTLAARYFDFTRKASATLEGDIQYGDVLFQTNSTVDSEFNLTYGGLSYRWSFTQKDGVDVYLIAGLDYVGFGGKLGGNGLVYQDGVVVGTFDEQVDASIGAPVPVLGLGLSIELTRRLFLKEEIEAFAIRVAGIEGSLVDNRLSLEWVPFQHVGFGLGYNSIRLKADETDGEGVDGSFNYEVKGGRIYLTVLF